MTLTVPSIQDLKKVTVLIIDTSEDSNLGSGTIVCVDDELYVLTAAHVVANSDKTCHETRNIIVTAVKDDKVYTFDVKDIVCFKYDEDCAVLMVENKDGFPVEPLKQVRILKQAPTGSGFLSGFGHGGQSVKAYSFNQVSDEVWALKGFDVAQQPVNAKENWGGFSGGGIFYKGESDLYIAAYMKGLCDLEGNRNEFVCFPSTRFANNNALEKIVVDEPVDYTSDNALRNVKKDDTYFQPLALSILPKSHNGEFISNDVLQRIIGSLKSDENRTIMLTALSGLGKSRLLYEAFKENLQKPYRYYCKYYDGGQELLGELRRLLQNGIGNEGLVIIDDCPVDLLKEVVACRNAFNNDFRVIATNNDFFNIEDTSQYKVVRLEPSQIRERVNQFIEDSLYPNDLTRESIEEIKKLSDGFPQMAIALVDEFRKGGMVSVNVVEDLMPKLLKFDSDKKEVQKTIMQTLSLCLPLPYSGNQEDTYCFMLSEDLFTPLNGMSWSQRRSMAQELINKYNPTLIDIQSEWLHVRPFPLAVWLTSEWFKHVCNCNEHFKDLINKILERPKSVQNAISEGFCKHIEQMHGNKAAFALVAELFDSDSQCPFFDEEVLTSGLGSKFFLSMSIVNPEAASQRLVDVFLHKDLEWLRENLVGYARRNLVWALEKLCFAKESYSMASKVMARLAVAENEDIGNNATAQFKQLFHLYLAGTEVSLDERIKTMEYLFAMGSDYSKLAVECCNHAFMFSGFNKLCGAEKFGFTTRKDYEPKTFPEIYGYWRRCQELLLKAVEEKSAMVDLVSNLVEENTFQWVRNNRWNLLEPLMETITSKRGFEWEKEYDALRSVVKEELSSESLNILEQWAIKIKPKTFITELKDARQELWSDYRMKEKDMLQRSNELFEPLAERFINDAVYKDKDEVDLILSDKDYIDNVFTKKLVGLMPESDLNDFFELLLNLILQKEESFSSPFLYNLCDTTFDSSAFANFIESIRLHGRLTMFYNLMAHTEQADLRHFKHLCSLHDDGELPDDFLTHYLQGTRALNRSVYFNLVTEVHRVFPERSNDLVHFILLHRFILSIDELCDEIVKKVLLEYKIGENSMTYDYFRLLVYILENSHDVVFAKSLNRKLIEAFNQHVFPYNSEGVFPALLKYYTDDVWDDFMKAFLSPDYFLFYYQVKDELGSGYGFGKGPLFKINEERLRELCEKQPDTAPVRLAAMAPCFDADSNDSFSGWFIWLLDNYGDKKEVLDSLHSNLGSFSWTGSTIPYYKRNVSSFEKLIEHKRLEVRNWAKKCLNAEKELLKAEISNEDFMRIRY